MSPHHRSQVPEATWRDPLLGEVKVMIVREQHGKGYELGTGPAAAIAANLAGVRAWITEACRRVGREPANVRLLSASKSA